MRTLRSLLVVSLAILPFACSALGSGTLPIASREIAYGAGDVELRGFLAYPADTETKRPGVLVVHEWWGHNEYARTRALQLAGLGYVALAVDMYGDGRLAEHPGDAQAFMQEIMGDLSIVEARFQAGLDVLREHEGVDPERTAAIGYCMGGGIVLQMARRGVDLDAVASFHGSLGTDSPAKKNGVQPEVLVLHGAADPFVPEEQLEGFRQEMLSAGVAFEIVEYEGVVHSFTNPGATVVGERFDMPLRYDAEADADSWARMLALFRRAL